MAPRPAFLEPVYFGAEPGGLLLLIKHIEGQLFNFLQQAGVELHQIDPLAGYGCGGGDARQVLVFLDVPPQFG